jgi:uncharacterized protein
MNARRPLLVLLAVVLTAGLLAAAPAGADEAAPPPHDYIAQADTLSQPDFPEIVTEALTIPAHDGVELYLEITKPDPGVHGDGPWPVILEASPYHGTIATRIGDRIFPDPRNEAGNHLGLTGYFAPRGYAVVMMDLRGTGRSQGCLDHLGPNDAADLTTTIEWLADQDWSNGRVGMTGHSYVGSTPSAAAAQRPRGLVTIIPSAGLASMYDHQYQKGVPWLLQWVGPMAAYASLSTDRHLPPGTPSALGDETGDNFGNDMQYAGCGWTTSSLTAGSGQVTGQYELWHAMRDHRKGAIDADIPIFMIHGVHDNAARIPAAEWFFDGRYLRDGDKVWIGQWDHGSTNGRCGNPNNQRVLHPTCRFEQFQYAVHAWFDYHLKEMTHVDTGPAVEAFLNGEDPMSVTAVRDPETWGTRVLTDTIWRRPAVRAALYPDATDGSLAFTPPEQPGTATFVNTNAVLTNSGSVTFTSEPLAEDTVFLGLPLMQLNASLSTGQIAHLVVTLFRENASGTREPINFCAIQPQLRHGVHDIAPVVPLQEMALPLSCFTMAGWVPEGQKLVMQVAGRSPHHASFGSDANVTIYTGPNRTRTLLPLVPDAVLHDDVPLRED